MLALYLVLGIAALLILATGIWQVLCKRAIIQGAEVYSAEFTGYEQRVTGRKKLFYYGFYIPKLQKRVLSVHPAFHGERKELPTNVEVYYNSRVEKYCCLKGNFDSEKILGVCVMACLALTIAIILFNS